MGIQQVCKLIWLVSKLIKLTGWLSKLVALITTGECVNKWYLNTKQWKSSLEHEIHVVIQGLITGLLL